MHPSMTRNRRPWCLAAFKSTTSPDGAETKGQSAKGHGVKGHFENGVKGHCGAKGHISAKGREGAS